MKTLDRLFCVAMAAFALMCNAFAAEPSSAKPLRIVTVLPPGPDVYLRALGARLSELLGRPVIIDNKVGASGVLALQAVASAPPDGSVLLAHSAAFLIFKAVQPSQPIDPVADFVAIAQVFGGGASVVVVSADSPVRSMQDLIARTKEAPGKLKYGSAGIGFPSHLATESLLQVTGTQALHIPFKGSDYLQAQLRGDVDFSIAVITSAMALVKSGKLRALAATSTERLRDLPDVPTLRELLKSDLLVQEFWVGLAAPAKTPPEVIRTLHAATVKALGDSAVRKSIENAGNTPGTGESPAEFGAFIRSENEKWRQIVKFTGIKAE